MLNSVPLSFEEMWEKFVACDRAYDGLFYTAVKTTKIYCRPSCKSRKPKKINVTFYQTIQEAKQAGYRPCKRCQPDVEQSPEIEIVRSISAFIVNHYKQPLTLKDIADAVGLSPFYLTRIFKQETSGTPRMYLEKIRIDKAIHLLKYTDLTNLDICYEVGFQSPSNFYKVFHQRKKRSPNDYRKELQNELD